MLRVTAGAFLAGTGGDVIAGVKTTMGTEPRSNFSVAVQTLEGGLSPKLMATRTIGRSVKRLMRSRKRTGRNLRRSRHEEREQKQQHDSSENKASGWQTIPSSGYSFRRLYGSFRLPLAEHAFPR